MAELIALVLGQFVVSALVGLAGLCAFAWAVSSGLLNDVERIKHRVLDVEQASRDD